MINQNVRVCNFLCDTKTIQNYTHSDSGIILKLQLKSLPKDNRLLAEIPGVFKISQRYGNKQKILKTARDVGECLFQKIDENGCSSVIDIELFFNSQDHPEWKSQKLSLPVYMYDICEKELWVVCNKTHFRLVYGGIVVNEELIYGSLSQPLDVDMFIDTEGVLTLDYSNEIDLAKFETVKRKTDAKPLYYTPFGHNTFIGDVVNFYHNGTYHMLYMPDTHHHSNRWGCGAHHFEHTITRDFVNWEDCGSIWDITEQWQSTGTGTMFFHDGKYCVAFGLHTDRMIDNGELLLDDMKKYFSEHGESEILTYDEIFEKGKYPIGTSYAVSDDGLNFVCSNKIVNIVDNPSIYEIDGDLVMYSGGNVWKSNKIDNPWRICKRGFPPCGDESLMLNTNECPSYFEWNGYKYLIMGFTGFWRTEKDGNDFIDVASQGYDVYDGLSVPMAVRTDDNRVILAGWLAGIGWGSAVVHRELVFGENGNLGMKWLPELMPEIDYVADIGCENSEFEVSDDTGGYYIELKIKRGNAKRFAVRFIDTNGECCELQLDFENDRAQYSEDVYNRFADPVLPLCDVVSELKKQENHRLGNQINYENIHCKGRDFSIANVEYSAECNLRILVHYNVKMDTTVIDTEIDRKRTIITNRTELRVKKITVNSLVRDAIYSGRIYNAEIWEGLNCVL